MRLQGSDRGCAAHPVADICILLPVGWHPLRPGPELMAGCLPGFAGWAPALRSGATESAPESASELLSSHLRRRNSGSSCFWVGRLLGLGLGQWLVT